MIALEEASKDEQEPTGEDPVKCGCDEYPECTHVLYWHEGFKAGMARGREREQFETVLGQADYNPSCTKLHYVFHPASEFQVGERVRVVIEKLTGGGNECAVRQSAAKSISVATSMSLRFG